LTASLAAIFNNDLAGDLALEVEALLCCSRTALSVWATSDSLARLATVWVSTRGSAGEIEGGFEVEELNGKDDNDDDDAWNVVYTSSRGEAEKEEEAIGIARARLRGARGTGGSLVASSLFSFSNSPLSLTFTSLC
jgi:hypothetical protein